MRINSIDYNNALLDDITNIINKKCIVAKNDSSLSNFHLNACIMLFYMFFQV